MTDAQTEIARETAESNERIRREGVRAESYTIQDVLSSNGNPQVVTRIAHTMGLSPDRVRFIAAWAPSLVYSLEDDTVWYDKAWDEPDNPILQAMADIEDAVSALSRNVQQRQDAVATTAVAKEGERTSPDCTDATTSPVARMEAGDRTEEEVSEIARKVREALPLPEGTLVCGSCGWVEAASQSDAGDKCPGCLEGTLQDDATRQVAADTKDESHPSPLSGVREHVDSFLQQYGAASLDQLARAAGVDLVTIDHYVRAADNLKVGLSWAPVRFAEPTEKPPTSPLSSLSVSEYGGMVGTVGLVLDDYGSRQIRHLATAANVTDAQMRAYVAQANHLICDRNDVVYSAILKGRGS